MDRQRRRILKLAGVSGTVVLAGCTGSEDTDDASTETTEDTADDSSGGSETQTPEDDGESEEPSTPPLSYSQQAKLVADDGGNEDYFGGSVTVSDDGSTALIGARYDGDPNGPGAGSAYVFARSDEGWTQQTKLVPDDGNREDYFGMSVAVSSDGSTALIGAFADEGPDEKYVGSAYVFTRSGEEWTQQTTLTADDGDGLDRFGYAVALADDGETALIGARTDEDPNDPDTGSAYVFTHSGGTWTQQAKLVADDGDRGDHFGTAVSLAGNGETALIGAWKDEDPNGYQAGSAYVFTHSGGTWSQQAKLAADDGAEDDFFGDSIALAEDGSTALIGAHFHDDPNGARSGAAYVFTRRGGTWSQQAKLAADDGDTDDSFGASVGLTDDGSTALIGAESRTDADGAASGAAYGFTRSGEAWAQQATLAAGDGDDGDNFGHSISLAGDGSTVLIGANQDEDPNGSLSGSAYVFE